MEQFLQEKAQNFRAFLLQQEPDETLLGLIDSFRSEVLVATLYAALAREQDVMNELMSHCKPKDPLKAREKIQRYMDCFRECLKI